MRCYARHFVGLNKEEKAEWREWVIRHSTVANAREGVDPYLDWARALHGERNAQVEERQALAFVLWRFRSDGRGLKRTERGGCSGAHVALHHDTQHGLHRARARRA